MWYAIHTQTGMEERVRKDIRRISRVHYFDHLIINIVVPRFEVLAIRKNKRQVQKRKQYPGYILVHTDDVVMLGVNLTDYRAALPGFIGLFNIPLEDDEVERLLEQLLRLKADKPPEPEEITLPYGPGEKVTIVHGPFKHYTESIVKKINPPMTDPTVTISINILGTWTDVTLPYYYMKKETKR